MRKILKPILKTTFVFSASTAMIWAAVGQMPKTKTFHASSVKNFTEAASDLMRLSSSSASVPQFTQNLTNLIRGSIGMVAGYGSRAAYISLVCNGNDPGSGSCDGPPQVGIVGATTAIVNSLPEIASSAGITSCETAPSSGTFSGYDSAGSRVSLTFSTPTHTIPAGWVGGGSTYDHRVVFSGSLTNIGPDAVNIKVAYEFNCGDSPASYVALSMEVDGTQLPGWYRDIAVYNGPYSASEKGIEVYMSEHNGSAVRGVDVMRIAYDESTHKFKLWSLINSNIEPNSGQGIQMLSKVFAHGDYTTGVALILARSVFGQSANSDQTGSLDTAMAGAAGASNYTAESNPSNHSFSNDLLADSTATTAAHGSPTSTVRMACVNFNSPSAAQAPAHADCAGLAITAPTTAPAVDASGTWNVSYLFSVSSHLEHVN